jgi:DNA-binding NarL/FixJ family response regulator
MIFTRVVLADDHSAVRSGIRRILERAPDIIVVAEASDGLQALRFVEDLFPDVLVLDMEMPGLKGVEVAQHLKAAYSPVQILALSSYDDKQYILGSLANGALGYLLKEEAPERIVDAVRGVARGEGVWISQQVAAKMSTWDQEEEETGTGSL